MKKVGIHNITSNEIHISGYDIARRDRPLMAAKEVVCIFIKSSLNFRLRDDLHNELLAIEICKTRSRPFLVATWYRPPNSSITVLYLLFTM